MDIISEILETDKLAEEKLEQARQKRSEILEGCQREIERIKADSENAAKDYKAQREQEVRTQTAERNAQIKVGENEKIKAFEQLYEKNHKAWEKEILDNVLGR